MPPPHLQRYRDLVGMLDARFRIPGTSIRFGWDALIGLVPGAGDAAGGLIGAYGLWVAFRLGAPNVVLARMLLYLGIDVLIGSVPVAGDVFDVAWRSNLRNLALLEEWLARPHRTSTRSMVLFGALLAGLVIMALAAGWFALWLLRRLASA